MSTSTPATKNLNHVEDDCTVPLTREEILLASHPVAEGLREVRLSVPSIRCGGCLRTIERTLAPIDGVAWTRANLTTKSVTVRWPKEITPPPIVEALSAIGHTPHLADNESSSDDKILRELIRSLAVAGFATANIMALSVAIWSGAGAELRNAFHILSALIAFPTLVYSGRVFYQSAWVALRHARANMDVPITIGIGLTFAMSLNDTFRHGPHAYFDATVMLLFFLLIGRTLDHAMRAKVRTAVNGLARLTARGATVERQDGAKVYLAVEKIKPGMTILVAAGERIPVDARVVSGDSTIDRSLVTGESAPVVITAGAIVEAGTLNLDAPLRLEAMATADNSFLAEMVRLMAAAETGRPSHRRMAEKASILYAPVVHGAAFFSFVGWALTTGDYHQAATTAVAVLIITCPCALGLAVPIVQVIAARRLFEHGIMVKDGSALERLAEADTVVFDKTGTLTDGQAELADADSIDGKALRLAATLAIHSRHPQSRALVAAQMARGGPTTPAPNVREVPGRGLEAQSGASIVRLGRADWALDDSNAVSTTLRFPSTVLSMDGRLMTVFEFREQLRPYAGKAIRALKDAGLQVEILSGDCIATVESLVGNLGVDRFEAGVRPSGKTERLAAMAEAGHRTLMVGDGLNDVPALAAAYVSMAPSSAVDIGRNTADFVFFRKSLEAVPFALALAKSARRLIHENFAVAVLYNMVALPFAIAGFVTPLSAALAMSLSSVIVVANAMRLQRGVFWVNQDEIALSLPLHTRSRLVK